MSGNRAAPSARIQARSSGILSWLSGVLYTSAVDVQLLGLERWQ